MDKSVNVIVGAAVRRLIKEHDLRLDGDFIERLEGDVQNLVTAAIERAKANGRKTLRPCDL